MFSPKAKFVHGAPTMVDYTNSGTSQVNAGDVLIVGSSVRIAHNDIPAGQPGELAAGGGVYDFLNGGQIAATDGNLVRWDNTNLVPIGGTVAANLKIGPAVGANGTAAASVRVKHVDGLNL